MKRLSEHTTRILSLLLTMIMLAVMLPLAVITVSAPQPVYAACTAQTTIYNFSSGGGTNKWCWEGLVYSADWNSGHPTSPSNFATSYGYAAGGSSAYTAVSISDNSWWKSSISHDTGCCVNDRNGELFTFKINEASLAITNIQVTWEGHGTTGLTTYQTTEKLWHASASTWNQLHDQTNIVSDTTWTDNIASGCSGYIDGTGNLSVFVASERSGISGSCGIWTDKIEVNITYVSSYTLTYTAGSYGSISGTSPQTVSCGASGSAVTAVPVACYHFVNWNDSSTSNPRTDTNVAANISVIANFAINTSTLTVNSSNSVGGSTSGGGSNINCGTNSSVSATANPCYHFVNWTQTAGLAGNITIWTNTSPTTNIMVNGTANVTANFAINTSTLTVNASPSAGGSPSGTGPYSCGGTASISANNNSCYTFVNWTATSGAGNITIADANSASTTVTVNGTATVTANFAVKTRTLTITSDANGSVNTPGIGTFTYNCGQNVSIIATANSCYAFANWTGDTGNITNVNAASTTITMNGNYSIQANFVWNCYTMTVFNSGGIWTVPTCVNSVQVLVVAGGGGGGGAATAYYSGGGGGGGGISYSASYSVTPGKQIAVVVGAGGYGGNSSNSYIGQNGEGSSFNSTLTATGGGGGGAGTDGTRNGASGGCGGGGGVSTIGFGSYGSGTQGQHGGSGFEDGTSGHNAAGGGGGNSAVGATGTSQKGGNGGSGGDPSGTFGPSYGESGVFAGGGGGGAYKTGGSKGAGGGGAGASSSESMNGLPGDSATPNTGGGGGGGGGGWGATNVNGGNGGNGIVIIRYTLCANYTLTTSAGSGGTVTNPGVGTYTYTDGALVNIVANPNPCYSFVNWTGNTSTITDPNSCSATITISGNYSIQANFNMSIYTLSVSANPSEGGSPSFDGSGSYTCGTVVNIYANTNNATYTFAGWTPPSGIANASAETTTVNMTQNRSFIAQYTLKPTPTPNPSTTPVTTGGGNSTLFLSWHITQGNFSLSKTAAYIVANMTAGNKDSMGKYLQKQLTIHISQRPSAAQSIWGDSPLYAASGLFISGNNNVISGDIRINGTVNVTGSANQIAGTLACQLLLNDPPPYSGLTFTLPLQNCTSGAMPDIGNQQSYFKTDLAAVIASGTAVGNYSTNEYVFPTDANLTTDTVSVYDPTTNTNSTVSVYTSSNRTLNTGLYYSPGTITLSGSGISGNVTFIANKIVITNSGGSSYNDVISLKPYRNDYNDLLFWANGSQGTLSGSGDGDIQINGAAANNPCVDLEGVLYAPNGEMELAGSGVKYWNTGLTYVIYRATLDKGAVISKYITISGNYWYIFRW